jgi:hypothetical protein
VLDSALIRSADKLEQHNQQQNQQMSIVFWNPLNAHETKINCLKFLWAKNLLQFKSRQIRGNDSICYKERWVA